MQNTTEVNVRRIMAHEHSRVLSEDEISKIAGGLKGNTGTTVSSNGGTSHDQYSGDA